MAACSRLHHVVSCVIIRARPTTNNIITVNINDSHLDCHSIQVNHTPDQLRRLTCRDTLINAVDEVVKSS